eukprot:g2243.t1
MTRELEEKYKKEPFYMQKVFLLYDTYHPEQANSQRQTFLRALELAEFVGSLPGVDLTLVLPKLRLHSVERSGKTFDSALDDKALFEDISSFYDISAIASNAKVSFKIMYIDEYTATQEHKPLLWISNPPRKIWTKRKKKKQRDFRDNMKHSRYTSLCPKEGGKRPFDAPKDRENDEDTDLNRTKGFPSFYEDNGDFMVSFTGHRIKVDQILCRRSYWEAKDYTRLAELLLQHGTVALPELSLHTRVYATQSSHVIMSEESMHPFAYKFVSAFQYRSVYEHLADKWYQDHVAGKGVQLLAVHWRVGDFHHLHEGVMDGGSGEVQPFGIIGGVPKVVMTLNDVLRGLHRKTRQISKSGEEPVRWYVATNGDEEWSTLQKEFNDVATDYRAENSIDNLILPRFEFPVGIENHGGKEKLLMEIAIVEQLICAKAKRFFGTYKSSFTKTIHELRNFQSKDRTEGTQQLLTDLELPLIPKRGGFAGYKAGEELVVQNGRVVPKKGAVEGSRPRLAVLTPKDSKEQAFYMEWAGKEWNWLSRSGLINDQNLLNDGLNSATCKNNGETEWTYNQGVILGGISDLWKILSTEEPKTMKENDDTILSDDVTFDKTNLLLQAKATANAAISKLTYKSGVLKESCDPIFPSESLFSNQHEESVPSPNSTCDADQLAFKGIFTRYLGYFIELCENDPNAFTLVGGKETVEKWKNFLSQNANSIWNESACYEIQQGKRFKVGEIVLRAPPLLGSVWIGPCGLGPQGASQVSAVDLMHAAACASGKCTKKSEN